MAYLHWAFLQITSYGVVPWLAFISIAFLAAKIGDVPGVLAGHLIVATAVVVLDVIWIQTEMHKPGWNPGVGPDQDLVFIIGVLLRIFLINSVLLPVSVIAVRLRRRPVIRSAGNA